MAVACILWRRLDSPGHDACRLLGSDAGWQIDGVAVFPHEGMPACLSYQVTCDRAWRTQQGQVHGWLGGQAVRFSIARTSGGTWTLNGAVISGLHTCVDLDLGFTPATNLLQIRRLALTEGQSADAPVAWLDVAAGTLDLLQQRYECRSQSSYWYQAPRFDYAGLLEVTPDGFVRRYPGLWEMQAG
ncbi:MAG: hypothetical protein EYC70_11245 [Planctomycetota bacterium]|nr:MAG: hypothetical protein EYC70_11245 [Planctomycetota bacterium]